jgi:hypothetical protein
MDQNPSKYDREKEKGVDDWLTSEKTTKGGERLREENHVDIAIPTCFATILPSSRSAAAVGRVVAVGGGREKSPVGLGRKGSATGTGREGGVTGGSEPPSWPKQPLPPLPSRLVQMVLARFIPRHERRGSIPRLRWGFRVVLVQGRSRGIISSTLKYFGPDCSAAIQYCP